MANSTGVGFPTTNLQKGHTFHDLDEGSTYIFIGGDPRLQSSWRLVNGIFSNNPDTAGWGLAQAGATWWNASEAKLKVWTGTTVANVFSQETQYKREVFLSDEFLTGTTSSGAVGALGWTIAGTPNLVASTPSNIGIFQIATGGVSGTQARIVFPANPAIDPSAVSELVWVARLNTNDANVTARFGAQNNVALDPPAHGIYFEKLDADTNWFAVTRDNGTQTRTDTGVAVTTGFATFTWTRLQSGVQFQINGTLVATHTTNIPVTFISPALWLINSAAASKSADFDYFQYSATGLNR